MKRNKFKRALHHLNKKNVVESAPTNSTLGVFSITPSGVGPVGWTDRTFTKDASGNPLPKIEVADFTVGENPATDAEARDTSGLFEDDGVTVKTLTPPGDNSYILGPFSSMWYAWGNFTTLGYIENGTRKMVNLGTITGKLSDWTGTSLNSYGQLTLEQALWFRDVKKFGDIDNDPANHNYRAFYPGPPSNTPDASGRYLCVIAASREAGGTETRPAAPDNPTQPDGMSPEDNFAAIMAKVKAGKKLTEEEKEFLRSQGFDDFVDGGRTSSPLGELALLGMSLAAAKALIVSYGTLGPAFAKMLANDWSKRTLSDAAYKAFLKTGKMPPGIQGWRPLKAFTLKMLKTGPTAAARRVLEAMFYAVVSKFTSSQRKKYESEIDEYKKKLGITNSQVSGTAAEAKLDLEISNIKVRLSADKATNVNRSQSEIKADQEELLRLQQEKEKMAADREASIDPFANELKPNLGAKEGDKLAGTFDMMKRGQVPFLTPDQVDKILVDPKYQKLLQDDPDLLPILQRMRAKNNKKPPITMVAQYQSKRKVLNEIRKPTILPEEKKKFKVKPRVLGHPSNKTLSNQMKDTTPNVAFKKEIPVWSMNQKMRNARESQKKKNEVLEYLGSSGDHWNYMTKTIKEHNKKMIKLNYGGKKNKVTRKEQVDKDTLVFMEDDLGNKSSVLQSKINEMQAEAGDKEMFAKYYDMNPQKKRSLFKEVVKRGVFDYPKKPSKKGYPDKEPAQLDPNTGMHPEYGKKYKHDKLDPQSAESMPMQGNPEIDVNIAKNLNPESKKRKTKVLNQPNG